MIHRLRLLQPLDILPVGTVVELEDAGIADGLRNSGVAEDDPTIVYYSMGMVDVAEFGKELVDDPDYDY